MLNSNLMLKAPFPDLFQTFAFCSFRSFISDVADLFFSFTKPWIPDQSRTQNRIFHFCRFEGKGQGSAHVSWFLSTLVMISFKKPTKLFRNSEFRNSKKSCSGIPEFRTDFSVSWFLSTCVMISQYMCHDFIGLMIFHDFSFLSTSD